MENVAAWDDDFLASLIAADRQRPVHAKPARSTSSRT
jgi:hypothetical protein